MEFKNVYLIPITLFVLGVCLLLNLPFWIALIPAVIMVLGVIYKFWETGASQSAPASQQSVRQQRNYRGWIVPVVILVVVGWLLWSIGNNIAGTPDKIYSAQELKSFAISGNWQLQNDELVCNGNYYNSCEIVIPNKGNIGGLTINPGMTALPDTDVSVGNKYLIKYYSQNLTDCNGKRDGKKYHRAIISYGGISVNDYCSNDEDDGTAEPLWIGTPHYRLMGSFPGLMYEIFEYPKVYIGVWNIRNSYINDKNLEYLGGKIKISSKKTITIRKVEITHSSYSWKELFYKTFGL